MVWNSDYLHALDLQICISLNSLGSVRERHCTGVSLFSRQGQGGKETEKARPHGCQKGIDSKSIDGENIEAGGESESINASGDNKNIDSKGLGLALFSKGLYAR